MTAVAVTTSLLTTSYPCGFPRGLPNAGGFSWSSTLYEYQCNSGFRMTGHGARIICDPAIRVWSSSGISCVPIDTRRTIHNQIHVQGVPSWAVWVLCALVGLIALSCLVTTIAYLCGYGSRDVLSRKSGSRRSRHWGENEISDVETGKQSSAPYDSAQYSRKLWVPHSRPARDNVVVVR